jgi:high-affinity nickel permease
VFGLDDFLASLSDGTSLAVVAAVAILLGLRHATDPDHLAAVSTLLVSAEHRGRAAARLGAAWGAGHAATLFAFGAPVVLFRAYSRKPSSGARRRPSGS